MRDVAPMEPSSLAELRSGFESPPADARILMRWWWFGPFVEDAELVRELTAMRDAGIGGVEVSVMYPLSVGEPDEGFLSPRFLASLRLAAETARGLGLRFDLTIGSGWSYGGPHIGPDLAARRLRWDRREIAPGALAVPVPEPWPGEELVAAFVGNGAAKEPPAAYLPLAVAGGVIDIPAGAGPRTVLLAFAGQTGQNVKRAAAGAEGFVLDHYDRSATERHLEAVGNVLLAAVPSDLVTAVFCDSLEVYDADWTPGMFEEFARRRGYDLRPRLWELDGYAGSPQLRVDYFRTLSELYEENFLRPVREWAHRHGVLFRVQSYGEPPARVGSYRFADLVEGEGWGWKTIPQTKWASSAAHALDRPVVSSETWTWLHSPSFRATPLDLKGEAHEHFLLGINQLIGHGWPYSPADAEAPGWAFYAAAALSDRNPWWPVMAELARYLQRLSWVLRQGRPVADVALYAPTDDAYLQFDPTERDSLNLWRHVRDRVGRQVPAAILDAGYGFDLLDDGLLQMLTPERYPVVVLPFVDTLAPATAAQLGRYVAAGGAVLAVGGSARPAGATFLPAADGLAAELAEVLPPDVAVTPASPEIGVVHRRLHAADLYFVANTGADSVSFRLAPRSGGASYEMWDARGGAATSRRPLRGGIPLTLAPYAATVVVVTSEPPPPSAAVAFGSPNAGIRLTGPWTIAFSDSPDVVDPVSVPGAWEDDARRADFSGSATYRTGFLLESPPQTDEQLLLDFGPGFRVAGEEADATEIGAPGKRGASYRAAVQGPVGEVATVRLNGTEVGSVWAPPYRLDVTAAVVAGNNELEVTVSNTGVGALRANTELRRSVDEVTAAYGARFVLQDVDDIEPTRSGLLAVPTIVRRGPRPV